MFASLDRIDLELRPNAEGRKRYIQTDHRTCAETEATSALSTLFAVIRVLNPKRFRDTNEPEPIVLYSVTELPPPFLAQAIAAAGGQLIQGAAIDAPLLDSNTLSHGLSVESIVAPAMTNLVHATQVEFDVPFDLDGLLAVEQRLASLAISPEDEFAYWSAVIKLGSFAGELIRVGNGGHWKTHDNGSLPLELSTSFDGGEATVNPLGKAIKRMAEGEDESLVPLVKVVRSKRR